MPSQFETEYTIDYPNGHEKRAETDINLSVGRYNPCALVRLVVSAADGRLEDEEDDSNYAEDRMGQRELGNTASTRVPSLSTQSAVNIVQLRPA